jgi:hypothetical protein
VDQEVRVGKGGSSARMPAVTAEAETAPTKLSSLSDRLLALGYGEGTAALACF